MYNSDDLTLDYNSPRWSAEYTDCSMPVTFDTYSVCSYNCLYCFAFFQKSCGHGCKGYNEKRVRSVNPDKVMALFNRALDPNYIFNPQEPKTNSDAFIPYIRDRYTMQWGGLADGFDDNEKKYGVTLDLLKFFDSIDYPLSISTKGTWWTKDPRYMDLFKKHAHNWHIKISIITSNEIVASVLERGVDSPKERFAAIKRLSDIGIHVTLRLRPYMVGISDDWRDTVMSAREAGADSVTTEFFCLEGRAEPKLREKYKEISKLCGFDLWDYYAANTPKPSGYRRLNYKIKKPIMTAMRDLSHTLGMRFYVSDAHGKGLSDYTCCCGCPPEFKVSKGQFAEALQIAKAKGVVRWCDISGESGKLLSPIRYYSGVNSGGPMNGMRHRKQSLSEMQRFLWNTPKQANSPYGYFEGILYPVGLDADNNVIYKYNRKKAE